MSPLDSRRAASLVAALLVAFLGLGFLVVGGATAPPAGAAVAELDVVQINDPEDARRRKLQSLLAELGLYGGPLDGRPSAALSAALLQFLQSTQLPLGSELSDAVLDQLEAKVRVYQLTRFLATLGREQSEQARAALLSQPATRDLVAPSDAGPAGPGGADTPAASVFACLRTPAPGCLIAAAVEASDAVVEPPLRDWALSEIVKAQARAGAGDAARATLRRITDGRQIIVSLRDLAIVQAERGDRDGALATARSIPDGLARVEAVLAIAGRQLDAGALRDARASLDLVDAGIEPLSEPLRRAALRARLATLRARAGDSIAADAALGAAEAEIRRLPVRDSRATGFGFVATALAEMGRPGDAVRLIAASRIADDAPAALAAAAGAAAQARDPAEAGRVAALIVEPRFRAVALVQLATIEARQSEPERAAERLVEAGRVAATIDETSWRDYPLGRISQAYIDLKQPEPAAAAARAIADPTSRARLLFVISHLEAARGAHAALDTAAEAEQAAEAIGAPLDHCWMLTEVALAFSQAGDPTAAQAMVRRAAEIAGTIQEPASRARAFSRVASVMLDL